MLDKVNMIFCLHKSYSYSGKLIAKCSIRNFKNTGLKMNSFNIRLKRKLIILGFDTFYDGKYAYICAIGSDITYKVNLLELKRYVNDSFSLRYFDIHLFFFILSGLKFIFMKIFYFFPLCFFLIFILFAAQVKLNYLLSELNSLLNFMYICQYIILFEFIVFGFYFLIMIFYKPFYLNFSFSSLAKSIMFDWINNNQL